MVATDEKTAPEFETRVFSLTIESSWAKNVNPSGAWSMCASYIKFSSKKLSSVGG